MVILLIIQHSNCYQLTQLIYSIKNIVYYQNNIWEYENTIRYVLWKINNLKCISPRDQYSIFSIPSYLFILLFHMQWFLAGGFKLWVSLIEINSFYKTVVILLKACLIRIHITLKFMYSCICSIVCLISSFVFVRVCLLMIFSSNIFSY